MSVANFASLFAALVAIGAPQPLIAQTSSFSEKMTAEIHACRRPNLDVCVFEVFSRYMSYPEFRKENEDLGPYLAYSAVAGGIRAAVRGPTNEARSILETAIIIVDEIFSESPESRLASTPLHLYRAESCKELGDWECFHESAGLLLELQVKWRSDALASSSLAPPFRWSEISEMRVSIDFDSPYRWSGDMGEMAEHDPTGTNFEERIDRILVEAERRLQ